MNPSQTSWFRVALLGGLLYLIIGRVAPFLNVSVRVFRLGAWLLSCVIFCAHIAYEHFKLRSPSKLAAMHVATAVAIGAFGLAVAGMVNSMSGDNEFRLVWVAALIAWPALTAIPAFIVALVASAALGQLSKTSNVR